MDLRGLKYFQAVYEQGSVSGAARVCFISQPSISSAIAQLEQQLGVELFVRHPRGVFPTAAADSLYPYVKEMTNGEKVILGLFSNTPAPVPLRLGLMRSLGAKRMSHLLTAITERVEHLELTLVDPNEPCDARVILSSGADSHQEFIPVWTDSYYLALPASWPLAQKELIELRELDGLAFINRSPCEALDRLKGRMTEQGVKFQPRANIRTIEYAWPLVAAGVGAALLPDWQEIRDVPEIQLRPIKCDPIVQTIGLSVRSDRRQSPVIKEVIKACHEQRGEKERS
ncbi:LysR family transcriptional regulator [Shewanella submarina]|uniref:LysR family transcriptional regulator n=1 Tax=Shewanella submarina TaxID=2016376 RepID=A0ABV7GEU1_9GAMM|nr:LysR family transcriptional regulator [Shewanella submarina]MCL1037048.1 LysR family transcriptional regulator [Shewanella submarina]